MAFPEIPLPELLRDLPEEQQALVAGGVSEDTSSSADSDGITGSSGISAKKEGDTWNRSEENYSSEGTPVNRGLLGDLDLLIGGGFQLF